MSAFDDLLAWLVAHEHDLALPYIDSRALRADIARLAAIGCRIQISPIWRGRVRHGVAYAMVGAYGTGVPWHQFEREYTRNDSGWSNSVDGDPLRFKTGPKQRALYALVQDAKAYMEWSL